MEKRAQIRKIHTAAHCNLIPCAAVVSYKMMGFPVRAGFMVERRVHDESGRHAALSHFDGARNLSIAGRRDLERQFDREKHFEAGHELVVAGAELSAPLFLVSGWAAQVVYLRDGRRQIIDFNLPGDLVGYCARSGARAGAATVALTRVHVVSAISLGDVGLAQCLREIENDYERRLLRQIVRNGRQSAIERVASLLFEFYVRMDASGQVNANRFAFPITQEMLADGLGLSVVHVNRTMQQLRRANLVATEGLMLEIRNADALASLAQSGG